MPLAATSDGPLHFEVLEPTCGWVERPETIVFHHGIGASAGIWGAWLPKLVDRYRIVRFDMRGYGRSTIPDPSFRWSRAMFVRDVMAVLDAAGCERVHLVGESIGGTIGLACAIDHPDRIATLAVSNGSHVGASVRSVEAWQSQLDQGVKVWSDAFLQNRFHEDTVDPVRRAWFARQQEAWPAHSSLNALGVLIGADLGPELHRVRCPVLILHPDGSPYIPVETAVQMHRLLPGSWLRVFAHAKHGLPFSHAFECVAAFADFLEAHPGRG